MKKTTSRPLSPHLQVYKPEITSVLSILHRMTGCVLSLGLFYIVYLLYCAKIDQLYAEPASFVCMLFFSVWIFSVFFHLYNGVRHLFWDIGIGLEISDVYKSGYAVIGMTTLSTLIVLGGLLWHL